MRVRVHIGVDPERHVHFFPHLPGNGIDLLELGDGFDIKKQDPGFDRGTDLFGGLPHSGVNDSFSLAFHFPGPEKFAPGNDVEARAFLDERAEDRQVGVRLHGITDERLHGTERFLELREMFDEGLVAVDVGGRAGLFEDLTDAGLVAIKLALLVIEVVHLFFVKIGPGHFSTSQSQFSPL